MAPLATPVVPPVYCRKATSSCVCGTGVKGSLAPSASTVLKRVARGSSNAGTIFLTWRTTKFTRLPLAKPSMSPMEATTTCSTAVRASTCCSVLAKFSRMMMALAPESRSWCSSSRGVYSGLTLTTTKPARSTAAIATGNCSTLSIMSATRSPFFRPRDCSQAATARDISSTSP